MNILTGLGKVASGVGKGIADVGQGVWDASVFGQTQRKLKQQQLMDDLAPLQDAKTDDERIAFMQDFTKKYPGFKPVLEGAQKARAVQHAKLQSEQRKDNIDQASKLAGIASNIDLPEDVRGLASDEMKSLFGNGTQNVTPAGPSGQNQSELSPEAAAIFSTANKWLDRAGEPDTTSQPIINQPQPQLQAEPETKQPSLLSKFGSGIKNALSNMDTSSMAGYVPEGQAFPSYPDNKALFTSGVNPFQSATPSSPQQNIPPSFAELGITDMNAQQTLSEFEKALPGIDLRSVIRRQGTETFERMLDMLKSGELTKQEVIDFFKGDTNE